MQCELKLRKIYTYVQTYIQMPFVDNYAGVYLYLYLYIVRHVKIFTYETGRPCGHRLLL